MRMLLHLLGLVFLLAAATTVATTKNPVKCSVIVDLGGGKPKPVELGLYTKRLSVCKFFSMIDLTVHIFQS